MRFTKMQGLGNDYIYFNCFEAEINNPSDLAVKVSDRHFGVGGDGIVLILPSKTADARMRMFNADGSEAEMCGNAIRCVGKYLFDHQLITKENVSIETLAGIKELRLEIKGRKVETVRVDMGEPVLNSDLIPVTGVSRKIINEPISVNGHSYHYTAVSMGNPHCVIFTPAINDAMVLGDGPILEVHQNFPRKINVEFARVISRNTIQMRVWERGSGETMACGTGACATVVAAVLNQLSDSPVTVQLQGGNLLIEWNRDTNHILMTGPAVEVFQGEWLN